jgi:type II secretory pathway component PulK
MEDAVNDNDAAPHAENTDVDTAAGKARPPQGQMGIAILMVLVCLAMLAPFTASFNYQSRVDWQSAINVRDEVAARQIQRGAMQLSLLLFEIQRMVFNQKQFQQFMGTWDITQVAPYLMSVFGTEDGAEGLGALAGVDTSAFGDLAIEGGSFEYRVYAESGKINVNCLAKQPAKAGARNNVAGRTVESLEALMLPTIYNPLFEEEKADGQFYTRAAILAGMADYVDDDTQRFDLVKLRSTSGAERYRYSELHDPYQARNGYLDSVEELHLVEGIDDDWMAAFSHELTTYGECKVNLNFASAEQIALVIRHSVENQYRDKVEGENFLLKVMPLANYVVESREFSLFKELGDFKELVSKPDQFISPLAALGGDVEENRNLPRIPEGIPVKVRPPKGEDTNEGSGGLTEVATVKPERTYTIEVITEVGAVTKRLTATYDMQYSRSQTQGKGAWLYIRED